MKLPCAVTRDLLPLYAENMVEQETRVLIEEHLDECADCRAKLSEMNVPAENPVDTVKPLQNLKRQIRKKRLYAAALAALIVFVGVYTYFFRTMAIQLVPWQDGLIEIVGVKTYQPEDVVVDERDTETSESVTPSPTTAPYTAKHTDEGLVLNVNSIVNGFQEHIVVDDDGTHTLFIQALSTNQHSDHLAQSYYEYTICPIPDRLIYGLQRPQTLLWGTPMNGGVEILPRLALAYYLIIALVAAGVCGLMWGVLRKWKNSWIVRQLFFAPVSYILYGAGSPQHTFDSHRHLRFVYHSMANDFSTKERSVKHKTPAGLITCGSLSICPYRYRHTCKKQGQSPAKNPRSGLLLTEELLQ